jgi:tetratricopeptide (TPR) repeat protein
VQGELRKSERSWDIRARMTRTATGEIVWTAPVSVMLEDTDVPLQQSRLAAGIGHLLAVRIGELLDGNAQPATPGPGAPHGTNAVIEQATAAIMKTTHERFETAQAMLTKALADDPDNVDLAVSLAALQLRGIQMVWYSPADSAAAQTSARATLEHALHVKPDSIPVLEAYCRFLNATNAFVDSLVACARTLSLDPWDGMALYHIGLAQIQLGRFEDALATFQQADRFNTPEVSRWTWLLGAGWVDLLMDRSERNEDAVQWLQRSIAITPASGRSYMLLAVAYLRLGRLDEAKATMAKGLALRPGSTAANVKVPTLDTGEAYRQKSAKIIQQMIELGLAES